MKGMFCVVMVSFVVAAASGCALPWGARAPVGPMAENPVFVPATDREFLWNNLVDTVDDYFRVTREERMRLIGGHLTEGRLETYPTQGSTYLEPWCGDSTPGYEKLHATLQTIRRQAFVRVIPASGGYLIEVVVSKELEDLDRPERATAGSSYQRHDGTLVRVEGPVQGSPNTLGWISLGRDASLEQKILLQLRAKLTNPGQVTSPIPPEVNQEAYVD